MPYRTRTDISPQVCRRLAEDDALCDYREGRHATQGQMIASLVALGAPDLIEAMPIYLASYWRTYTRLFNGDAQGQAERFELNRLKCPTDTHHQDT